MAYSSTVVVALRFSRGVIIGADSQVTDPFGQVRWVGEKLTPLVGTPMVMGFTGQTAAIRPARMSLQRTFRKKGTLPSHQEVVCLVEQSVEPIYKRQQEKYPVAPLQPNIWSISVGGLVVGWIEERPCILEIEVNGLCDSHDSFRAIGSGTNSAQAVWHSFGGQRLTEAEEGLALQLMWRILQVSIETEAAGVSMPIAMWVVREGKTRKIRDTELDALQSLADRDLFFSLSTL